MKFPSHNLSSQVLERLVSKTLIEIVKVIKVDLQGQATRFEAYVLRGISNRRPIAYQYLVDFLGYCQTTNATSGEVR